MPCGWEGNCMSGVALAMRHRLKWFIHMLAHGLDREMSTPPTLSCGVWPIYRLSWGIWAHPIEFGVLKSHILDVSVRAAVEQMSEACNGSERHHVLIHVHASLSH